MKMENVWEQLRHILMYLCRKYEDKHIKIVGNQAKLVTANPFLEMVLLYFLAHLGHILKSVAAAAYATQIPIIIPDFQQFVCLSAWNNSTYTRSISVGFYTGSFYKNSTTCSIFG
jgi:hypothetical protein